MYFRRRVITALCAGTFLVLIAGGQAQQTLPLSLNPQPPLKKAYHLAANDVVQISVYQEADLDAKVRISRDGSVTLPLLGDVRND